MQHIDTFGERRNVEHSVFKPGPDPNVPDDGSDGRLYKYSYIMSTTGGRSPDATAERGQTG
jgi:hypothetical protein